MCKEEFAEKIDKAVFPGLQGGPHEHVIAAKAVCFKEAKTPEFKDYAEQIVKNSRALCKVLKDNGLRLVTGGSDTHLALVDVTPLDIKGKEAENVLEECNIYCNKNTIPFDTGTPWNPSGIRIGTPVLTTRGMKEKDMEQVGTFISDALHNATNKEKLSEIKKEVTKFCSDFQFYK